jgi:hypothetical protein
LDFLDLQIPPPSVWTKFEDLCRALFAAIWNDQGTQKNGRTGQAQHGVDVFGQPEELAGTFHGVQCKGKDGRYGAFATSAEFDEELAKAEKFSPQLARWYFVTTAPNDAALQKHAREVSQRRIEHGLFRVDVFGWESVQALLAQHPEIIDEFYPELGTRIPEILRRLESLPAKIEEAIRETATKQSRPSQWQSVDFESERDLGPALMGRPLGAADVKACPEIPEAKLAHEEIERAYSARLVGIPGAGKSVCALQTARRMHDKGWRVVRCFGTSGNELCLTTDDIPTLHVVDDAHLLSDETIQLAEQATTSTKWLLSTHTAADDTDHSAGAIPIDTKRAVAHIASELRRNRDETLRVVMRVDDRVGDDIGDESIDNRLSAAEKADFPWQFCFILGGGWRRAKLAAQKAHSSGNDLVLAATAIRQIASRDAQCQKSHLECLLSSAGVDTDALDAQVAGLVRERSLISIDDLRCPHQRFATVILGRILEGQSEDGRQAIGKMLRAVLRDSEMPLLGLFLLLRELSSVGRGRRWTRLVKTNWLDPLFERCRSARTGPEVSGGAHLLNEFETYTNDWLQDVICDFKSVIANWIADPPERTGYAIGHLLNVINQKDEETGREILNIAGAERVARAMNAADPVHAGDIANMLSLAWAGQDEKWVSSYLRAIDRDACKVLVSNWPDDAYISSAAEYCRHFVSMEEEFGLDLIEDLLPAIKDRMRANPQRTFHELDEIVWHSLKLFDPLEIYKGKDGPTKRMRVVGRKLCAIWNPKDLASKLSKSSKRDFQSATRLLHFLRNTSKSRFEATVAALDWDLIDETIGDDWRTGKGEWVRLLGQTYSMDAGRKAAANLIERNLGTIISMPTTLAIIAPEQAFRHVESGGEIALCYFEHFDWRLGPAVLAKFADHRSDLVDSLLKPHEEKCGHVLTRQSPSFYNDALLFLRIHWQVANGSFERMLGSIDPDKARLSWSNALRGKKAERDVGAYLVERTLDRSDALGRVARELRAQFPASSIAQASHLKQFEE